MKFFYAQKDYHSFLEPKTRRKTTSLLLGSLDGTRQEPVLTPRTQEWNYSDYMQAPYTVPRIRAFKYNSLPPPPHTTKILIVSVLLSPLIIGSAKT
jgi:hypothetical protein